MRISPLLISLVFLAPAAIAADQPATTTQKSKLSSMTIPIPGRNLSVSFEFPEDWKYRRDEKGQPMVYKPGPPPDTQFAYWTFDIKDGVKGRTIDQIMDGFAGNLARDTSVKDIKKELVDLENGKKAGSVTYSRTIAGQTAFSCDYFYLIDEDRMFLGLEITFTKNEFVDALHAISRSAKVIPNPPAR